MIVTRFNSRNFGDAMNVWLWPALLGRDPDDILPGCYMTGIGTLLSDEQLFGQGVPQAMHNPNNVVIGGSGAGYGTVNAVGRLVRNRRAGFVRGPHSAAVLGAGNAWITDPAVALAALHLPDAPVKQYEVSIIPHHTTNLTLFHGHGAHVIDPCGTPEAIVAAIRASSLVVAEAMHGAIAADALGTPFVPVVTDPRAAFKWADWLASMGLDECPVLIAPNTPSQMIAAAGEPARLSDRTTVNDKAAAVLEFARSLVS